ncbi:MAG TPA: hypothetical protein VGL81_01445 [Polyangiaceae bacterium]|jgi:hypothetical protein
MVRHASLAVVLACAVVTASGDARAYRPFDGTDADVAEQGDFELELGPVHWYSQQDAHELIAPATVLNLGYAPGWELVIDFQNFVGIDVPPGQARDQLLDTDILTKAVLVKGALQDAGPWPSVAAEFGPLLPDVNGENGLGASLDVIVSKRWKGLAVHVNNWFELSRGDLHFSWFEGAILEGDTEAPIRPVSEWFIEHEFIAGTTTFSGLVGAIWRAKEGLDLDVGLREASVAGERATEVRLGLTWTIGVWEPKEEKGHGGRPFPASMGAALGAR